MCCRAEVWRSRLEPAGQASGGGQEGIRNSSLDGHHSRARDDEGQLWSSEQLQHEPGIQFLPVPPDASHSASAIRDLVLWLCPLMAFLTKPYIAGYCVPNYAVPAFELSVLLASPLCALYTLPPLFL